jgi:nicotinic acetylcholine receptor
VQYLLFTFIMNTVSILVTVVIINWNFRGPRTHSMPNWIRVVFIKETKTFITVFAYFL